MVGVRRVPSWRFPNLKSRLPDVYYRHRQQLDKPSQRVVDSPPDSDFYGYKKNEITGQIERLPDFPIEVIYPKEADEGIWGGEGIVKGFVKLRKFFQAAFPRPRYWFPNLKKAVFYSEILDKYFQIICTRRTFDLVDQYYGFDSYILRIPPQDLKSNLALHLRRQMLLKLAKKDFDNANHGEEMLRKYQDCILPLEETEWFGLTIAEALHRQKIIDARNNVPIPLKMSLSKELISELRDMKESGELKVINKEDQKNWLTKLKSKLPF